MFRLLMCCAFALLPIQSLSKEIQAPTIYRNSPESIHEQLYTFVTEFQEMKPANFNLPETWHNLQYLLEEGASFSLAEVDINTQHRSSGATMLYCTSRAGSLQAAYYLLEQGANPNLQERIFGNTPMHAAAEKGYCDLILKLAQNDGDPNIPNHDGQTPLHKAVLSQQTDGVAALLTLKAYQHIPDRYGKRPIDYAKARGYEAIIALLTAH